MAQDDNGLIQDRNTLHGMTEANFGDFKWNKQRELNNGMSIDNSQQNDYQRKISSLGGGLNG